MLMQQHFDCWVFSETYIGGWSLVIVCNAALQVERQVVAADQDSLPELFFELTHIWLNAREVQFLWTQNPNFLITGTKLLVGMKRFLYNLSVRVQIEQFQASLTPHFGFNISGGLLERAKTLLQSSQLKNEYWML